MLFTCEKKTIHSVNNSVFLFVCKIHFHFSKVKAKSIKAK